MIRSLTALEKMKNNKRKRKKKKYEIEEIK
jgi:hypothetical protein